MQEMVAKNFSELREDQSPQVKRVSQVYGKLKTKIHMKTIEILILIIILMHIERI